FRRRKCKLLVILNPRLLRVKDPNLNSTQAFPLLRFFLHPRRTRSGRPRLPQKLHQLRLAVLPLRAIRQRLQRPLPARHFILAQDQRIPRAQLIRLPQRLAKLLLHRRKLHAKSRSPQIPRRANRRRQRFLPHPRDVHVQRLCHVALPRFLQRKDHAVFANRKADALRRRPAQQFQQPIISPATAHRILRTQAPRGDLKRRPHVVVQPAHQPPILPVRHAAQFQLPFHFRVMLRAIRTEVIADARQLFDNRLLSNFESSTRKGFVSIRRWLSAPSLSFTLSSAL